MAAGLGSGGSAGIGTPLFATVEAATPASDFRPPCIAGCETPFFPVRPRGCEFPWGDGRISQVPARGVRTFAGSLTPRSRAAAGRSAAAGIAFGRYESLGAPECNRFDARLPRPYAPLPTLHVRPCGRPRTARGEMRTGSTLHPGRLALPVPRPVMPGRSIIGHISNVAGLRFVADPVPTSELCRIGPGLWRPRDFTFQIRAQFHQHTVGSALLGEPVARIATQIPTSYYLPSQRQNCQVVS